MNRCWMLLCLATVGACQEGLAPEPTAEAVQEVIDCSTTPAYCGSDPIQSTYWQGQTPPMANAFQNYHAYINPNNPAEMVLALSDRSQGKVVWAAHVKGAANQQKLLGSAWGRGPVDVVRPPVPPMPIGEEFSTYLLERARVVEEIHPKATARMAQCTQ